jgi:ankyrin repeat protein
MAALALLLVVFIGYSASQWNSKADNALLEASGVGDMQRVAVALQSGAHVNAENFDSGTTPLILAAARKHFAVVMALVQAGADVNKRDGGGNPLFYASVWMEDKLILLNKPCQQKANNPKQDCCLSATQCKTNTHKCINQAN